MTGHYWCGTNRSTPRSAGDHGREGVRCEASQPVNHNGSNARSVRRSAAPPSVTVRLAVRTRAEYLRTTEAALDETDASEAPIELLDTTRSQSPSVPR